MGINSGFKGLMSSLNLNNSAPYVAVLYRRTRHVGWHCVC